MTDRRGGNEGHGPARFDQQPGQCRNVVESTGDEPKLERPAVVTGNGIHIRAWPAHVQRLGATTRPSGTLMTEHRVTAAGFYLGRGRRTAHTVLPSEPSR
jgi:hypothetical protein